MKKFILFVLLSIILVPAALPETREPEKARTSINLMEVAPQNRSAIQKATMYVEAAREYISSIIGRLNGKSEGSRNPDTVRDVAVGQIDKAVKELRKGGFAVDSSEVAALATVTTGLKNINDFGLENDKGVALYGKKEAALDTLQQADNRLGEVVSALARFKTVAETGKVTVTPQTVIAAKPPTSIDLYREKKVDAVSPEEANQIKRMAGFTFEEIQKMPVSGRLDLAEDAIRNGNKDAATIFLRGVHATFGSNAGRLQSFQAALDGLDLKDKALLTYRRELDAFKQAGGPSVDAIREALSSSDASESSLKSITSRLEEMEKKQQGVAQERDTLKQDAANLAGEVSGQKEALAAAGKEKEGLQQQLAATEPIRTERDTLQKKVGELEGRLKASEGMLSLTQSTVTRLQAQLAETEKLVKKTKSVNQYITDINLTLARLERSLGIQPAGQ